VARALALAAAIVVSLLAVSGAGGAGTQTPKRGGTVVVSWGPAGSTPCLNALLPKCNFAFVYRQEVLEGAFEEGPDFVLRPKLVSDVDVKKKPPFTLTYHIRPEARWSDGVPITARDFVFTHRAVLQHDSREFLDFYRPLVRRVVAVDQKTVRVVLNRRYAGWQGGLFWVVVPRHALVGEDLERIWSDRIDNPKTGRPIGSGPFLVQRWERGDGGMDRLVLVRNPKYWGPHTAYLDRVDIGTIGPGTALPELMEKGEVDVVNGTVAVPEEVLAFRRLPGVRLLSNPGASLEHLVIRMGPGGHRALRKKLVRRALAYAIDRARLPRALFEEIDPTLQPSDSAVFPPGSPHYQPNWSAYRSRSAQASRLLEQEGCREGDDGIYVCEDERLSLHLLTDSRRRRVATVPLVQEQLRQAGIEILPRFAHPAVVQQLVRDGEFDLTLSGYGLRADSVGFVSTYGCGGSFNFSGYCQRLVTADLDQADRIFDLDQRARVLNRADARMALDVPVIPLYQVPTYAAVRSTIRGYRPGFPFPLWRAENWWLER